MDMRLIIVLVRSHFPVEGFKMEQGAVIKYCVKLKLLERRVHTVKNVYQEQVCLN
jgi:hypothetical protein